MSATSVALVLLAAVPGLASGTVFRAASVVGSASSVTAHARTSSVCAGTPIVDITYRIVNDFAPTGRYWAYTDWLGESRVWQVDSSTYCWSLAQTGTFRTVSGLSPNVTGTLVDGLTGHFTAEISRIIHGTYVGGRATRGDQGTFDVACRITEDRRDATCQRADVLRLVPPIVNGYWDDYSESGSYAASNGTSMTLTKEPGRAEVLQGDIKSLGAPCRPYFLVDSRGSGEAISTFSQPGLLVLRALQARLGAEAITAVRNPYPARGLWSFFRAAVQLPGGYHQSVVAGKDWLANELSLLWTRCRASKVFLTGYSQGAQVTADVVQNRSRGNVIGVALFGDPYFNSRDTGADAGTYSHTSPFGGLGRRPLFTGSWKGHIRSYCHLHDPVCSTVSPVEFGAYRTSQHTNYGRTNEPRQAATYFARF